MPSSTQSRRFRARQTARSTQSNTGRRASWTLHAPIFGAISSREQRRSRSSAFSRHVKTSRSQNSTKAACLRAMARRRRGQARSGLLARPYPQGDAPSGQRRQEGHLGALLVVGPRRRAPLRHALRPGHRQMLRRDRIRKRDASRRLFPSRCGKDRAIRHHRRRRPLRRGQEGPLDDLRRPLLGLHPRHQRRCPATRHQKGHD